jgi:hypothetical protein
MLTFEKGKAGQGAHTGIGYSITPDPLFFSHEKKLRSLKEHFALDAVPMPGHLVVLQAAP